MMMKFMRTAATSLALLAAACATQPEGQAAQEFNDRAALADRSVQLVQTTATSLLRQRVITVEQDQLIQRQVGLAHAGIVLAKQLQSNNPAQAAATLTSAIEQIDALRKQTGATP